MPNKENNPAETPVKEDSKLEAAKKVAKAAKASGAKKKKAAGTNVLARADKAIPSFSKTSVRKSKIVWPDSRSVVKNTGIVCSSLPSSALLFSASTPAFPGCLS